MSTSCSVVVKGKAGHWTYEVHCGSKIVARGHRSTRTLAETAGAREMAVYASVSGGKRRGGGGATALEYGDDYVGGGGARASGKHRGGGGANLIPGMPGGHGSFGEIPTWNGGGGAHSGAIPHVDSLDHAAIWNGHSWKVVKNLGWLLVHWKDVESFEVRRRPPGDMRHATLIAHLRDGRTYATPYASRSVLAGFLNRPVFRGVPILWFGQPRVVDATLA